MKSVANRYTKEMGWESPHHTDLDSAQTLVLFFAARSFENQQMIEDLHQAFPKAHIAGCSTAGEILNGQVSDESLVYIVMAFENTSVQIESIPNYLGENIEECGHKMADKLYDKDLAHLFLLCSGFNINIDDFISGFKKNSGRDIPVSGGIAADGEAFLKTWVYHNGFYENGIVCIGLYGQDIRVSQGCEGGWIKFGLELKITKSQKNCLYEIDGEPALAIYKRYLGNLSEKLPSSGLLFPLAIRKNTESTPVVRTILSVDEATQSIIFAGEIPQGWLASLMRCSNEGLLEGARKAACQSAPNTIEPTVSLVVSCIGRRMVLGQGSFHELAMAMSTMPKMSHIDIGFYSYGEISERAGINSKLHNQTMTISTLYELSNGQIT
ncbi:MAG: hypothetical protein EPN84_11090 [Legionella sp.]|nr:MAG: hypothetical protein EPN84_11090 [Legionella sp.]